MKLALFIGLLMIGMAMALTRRSAEENLTNAVPQMPVADIQGDEQRWGGYGGFGRPYYGGFGRPYGGFGRPYGGFGRPYGGFGRPYYG